MDAYRLAWHMGATRLLPNLYQGSAPPAARDLQRAGVDTVVFCAREIQPPDHALDRLHAIRCPLDDNEQTFSTADWQLAVRCAAATAERMRAGDKVLVTCAQGLNRSGLVSAIVLHLILGWSGRQCVEYIQQRRPGSLFNESFVRALQSRI